MDRILNIWSSTATQSNKILTWENSWKPNDLSINNTKTNCQISKILHIQDLPSVRIKQSEEILSHTISDRFYSLPVSHHHNPLCLDNFHVPTQHQTILHESTRKKEREYIVLYAVKGQVKRHHLCKTTFIWFQKKCLQGTILRSYVYIKPNQLEITMCYHHTILHYCMIQHTITFLSLPVC